MKCKILIIATWVFSYGPRYPAKNSVSKPPKLHLLANPAFETFFHFLYLEALWILSYGLTSPWRAEGGGGGYSEY
jgi:hypothetical protein